MTQTMQAPAGYQDPFDHPRYLIRQKVFKVFGNAFHVYDESETQLIMYSKQKAFKLKEDIRLYSDETMKVELLTITARQVIDWSAAYDIIDPLAKQKVGAMRRKGWSSLVRDEWIILNAHDQQIGTIKEDSVMAALVRRFVDWASLFLPQKFHVDIGGVPVCTFKQNFNPFVKKLLIDFTGDVQGRLDKRLGLGAAILIAAIEGRQGAM
jgi:hypothetical protein